MPLLPAHTRALAERDTARRDADRARARLAEVTRELDETREKAIGLGETALSYRDQLERAEAKLAQTQRLDRVVADLVKDRLLVFLREGGVLDGLLVDADERTLTFADVHRRGADGITLTSAPGQLYVERTRVLYMQRVAAEQQRGE